VESLGVKSAHSKSEMSAAKSVPVATILIL